MKPERCPLPRLRHHAYYPALSRAQEVALDQLVRSFIRSLDGLDSMESHASALLALKDALGFDHIAYLGVHIPRSAVRDPFVLSSYPEAWTIHYWDHGYLNLDPVVRGGLERRLPFEWCEVASARRHDTFFADAAKYGIGRNGYSVPIRGTDGECALFSVNSRAIGREWRRLLDEHRHAMHLMACYFHASLTENVLMKRAPDEQPVLTPREVECLLWSAQGKTAWETSQILDIAERTVIFHLNNAKAKLGAASKSQALVKSIQLGLVRP